MPRDSSGNYTLPAGNPVVTGTLIESEWANTTLADIATQLNGVLTRDGLLAPLAPFKLVNGTESVPGLAFAAASGTGMYRTSSRVGFTWLGSEVFRYEVDKFVFSVEGIFNSTAEFNDAATFDGTAEFNDAVAFNGTAEFNELTAYLDFEVGWRDIPVVEADVSNEFQDTQFGMCVIADATQNIPADLMTPGKVISVYNNSASTITITADMGITLRLAGSTSTGTRTLAAYSLATLFCPVADEVTASGASVS